MALILAACPGTRPRTVVGLEGIDDQTLEAYANGTQVLPGVTLAVTTPPSPVLGGATIELRYTATTTEHAFGTLTLAYTTGSDFNAIAELEPGEGVVSWLVPEIEAPVVQLRLFVTFPALGIDNHVKSGEFAIDATPPGIPDVAFLGGAFTNQLDPPLEVQSCEPDTSLAFIVYDAAEVPPEPTEAQFQPCATGLTQVSLVEDGAYLVLVMARDRVGHRSLPLILSITLDRVPPAAPVLTLTSAALTNNPLGMLAVDTCQDRYALIIGAALESEIIEPCASLHSYTLVTDGEHDIIAFAIDLAGNLSPPSLPVHVTLDRTPPIVAIEPLQFLRAMTTYDLAISVMGDHLGPSAMSVAYSTGGEAYQAIVDGVPVDTAVEWTTPPTLVSYTTTRVRVTVSDLAGNVAEAITPEFTLDALGPPAPSVFLLNGTSGYPDPSDIQSFDNPIATFELHVPDDDVSTITHYCLKRHESVPTLSNRCWKPVPGTPAKKLDITDEPVRLGFLPGDVTLYAFVRDAAGNISQPIIPPSPDGEGKDHARVNYQPGDPPTVDNFFVTNTATACPTFAPSDVTTTATSDLYLRWNVDFVATTGIDPEEIRVEYTTDDVSYTPLGGPLTNDDNGTACSLAACGSTTFTGCYKWTGETLPSSYVRFRIKAQNKKGIVTVRSSVPALNVADQIQFIAGNSDPGIDGNATAAVFLARAKQQYIQYLKHSLVVNDWGVTFYLDPDNGVLWIDPDTGVLARVAHTTGDAVDGMLNDSVTPPSFALPRMLFMTHENHVLVWDKHSIRRILVDDIGVPVELETVLDNPAGCTGIYCECYYSCSVIPLPGGDFLFAPQEGYPAPSGWSIHRYHAPNSTTLGSLQDGSTTTVVPNGLGYSHSATADITTCYYGDMNASYDAVTGEVKKLHAAVASNFGACAPTGGMVTMEADGFSNTPREPPISYTHYANYNGTFAFTGLDGYLYEYWDNVYYGLIRYDHVSHTFQRVLREMNTYVTTTCPAGVHPQKCNPRAHDVFVDKSGTVFWSSFGQIRSIDFGDDGEDLYDWNTDTSAMDDQVVDVFGQPLEYGIDKEALTARIAYTSAFGVWNDGSDEHVTYADNLSQQIRQATVGKTITLRAGTGASQWPDPDVMTPAAGQPFYMHTETSFLVGPTGRIYAAVAPLSGRRIIYSDSAGDTWHALVGNGSTLYYDAADTATEVGSINFDWYASWPFGWTPNRVLFAHVGWNGSAYVNGMVKSYSKASGAQRHISGIDGPIDTYCAPDTPRDACPLNMHYYSWDRTRPVYDAPRARWIWRNGNLGQELYVFDDDGNAGPVGALRRGFGPTMIPVVFGAWTYRREGSVDAVYLCKSNGRLARATHDGSTWTVTELDWPIASLRCSGQDLGWSTDNTRLVFAYQQFGLGGIAAYVTGPP